MRLLLVQFSLVLLAASALGATKVVEGKIEAEPETGAWTLRIGTEAVPVAPDGKTRFWAKRAAADAKAFHVGDVVMARIAPDETPAALREIADKPSWTWLEGIRKGVQTGTMKGFDGKRLTLAFADGTEMAYRATEKSKITLGGKEATLGDLKPGQKLWAKGRTLPTLDVWLVAASDAAISGPVKKTADKKAKGRGKAAKATKLPASGKLTGDIVVHFAGQGLFDVTIGDNQMHIGYNAATAFTFGGVKCGPNELVPGRQATVTYRRDQYGRIGALRVEIR